MGGSHTEVIIHHPTVYNSAPLIDFIHFVTQHAPAGAILVICSTKQSFLLQLQTSIVDKCHASHQNESTSEGEYPSLTGPTDHPLFAQTLRLLAISRRIRLLFCPSVAAFYAQIATLSLKDFSSETQAGTPMLAILNVVRMHRRTASYSAQGLGKAIAGAVEAAWQMKHRLVLFEYPESNGVVPMTLVNDNSDPPNEPHGSDNDDDNEEVNRLPAEDLVPSISEDPWQEQVQILNATTKTFGLVGNRGWMGKTVRIADIAARWCAFSTLPGITL